MKGSSESYWWCDILFLKLRALIFSHQLALQGLKSDLNWLNCVYRCVDQPWSRFQPPPPQTPLLPCLIPSPLIPAQDKVLCGPGSLHSVGFYPHSWVLLSFFGLLWWQHMSQLRIVGPLTLSKITFQKMGNKRQKTNASPSSCQFWEDFFESFKRP